MVLTAFFLAYARFAALSLVKERHYEDVFRRALNAAYRRRLGWGWPRRCGHAPRYTTGRMVWSNESAC